MSCPVQQPKPVNSEVESLGIVFVTLPPLPPPPLVVKQARENTENAHPTVL